ncbi:regulator of chromosome condensation [Aureococcus anophagefferens]|uniref:Regulator of chromosome condensation n=1 Tax=Aureococcus anophagefferens TaxID=44056 RepID=A0ABR1G9L7_AURAN
MDIMGALAGLQDESQDEKKEEKKEAKPEAVAAVHAVEAPTKSCLVLCGSTDWVAAAKGAAGKQKQKQDGAQGDQFDSPVVVGGALAGVRVSYVASARRRATCSRSATARSSPGARTRTASSASAPRPPGACPGPRRPRPGSAPGTPVSAACGKNHTLVLYADGAVASAGCGERGALGHGDKAKDMPEMSHDPRVVEAVSDAVCIAAGTDFSLAGASTGKVYSWGWTEFGKLGQGDDGCYNTKDSSIKLTYTAAGAPG